MSSSAGSNHTPTIRLLGSQVVTALNACGELRADLRTLDGEVEEIRLCLAKMPASAEEYQALQVEVARMKERLSVVVGILAVLQIVGTAIAAYLAGR